jgi:hypothetical protein
VNTCPSRPASSHTCTQGAAARADGLGLNLAKLTGVS